MVSDSGVETDITVLTIREQTSAGDVRGIKLQDLGNPDASDMLKLIGRLSGQTENVMVKLSIPDLLALTAKVVGFFGFGPPTPTN